ncbi:MAG TPA: hypothetical protein VK149_05515 [Sideroxyarcus sp.]|nr:hypothetical protein [Sideroxyarcus sp.]
MRKLLALVTFVLVLAGCATAPPPAKAPAYASYAEMVAARPQPQDEAARAQECGWIFSEMQRQKSMAAYAASAPMPPQQRAKFLSEAYGNNAMLEARLVKVGCGGPAQQRNAPSPAR